MISPDSLDAKVEYGSVDSNYLDKIERRVYLFGKAYVKYKDLTITADYIVVDLDSSIATAEGLLDSVGKLAGLPVFKMGAEEFTAKKMRYNFRTRVGKIYEAVTQEGELYIHGEETKFVANADTVYHDDILYAKGALITTCTADHPHFGIRASKVKTIPDKLAVIGSSHLEVFGVPTPLWLPFGFYPVSNERRAGLILPRDYERSEEQGFGLRDVGYYMPLNDNIDLKLLTDIYFNGTWAAGVVSNYDKRYKYRGSIELRFSNRISEASDSYQKLSAKSFSIGIRHNQDPKANPNQTLGGNIDIKSNDFQSRNYNDAASVLTNTYSSNFSYSRRFPGKPYSFSAAFRHSQNTNTHLVTFNAPEFDFRLNRIYPFKNKNRVGPEQFYEKIAFVYSGSARTQLNTTDTTLFDKVAWQNYQYGAQHRANASLNFNALKFFNFTPAVDYGETWFFKTRDHVFHFDGMDTNFVRFDTIRIPNSDDYYLQPDTVSYGRVTDSLVSGFDAFRTFSASISMSTSIYGLVQFHKGWLRGIRHVMKPSLSFSYSPASPTSYYQDENFSILYPDSVKTFSRFSGLLYGASPNSFKQANINYSITNLFEAKYFNKQDSTLKKLKLFDNINVGGSYNIAADTLKWSPIGISGNTRFFKGITTVTVGATYSVYAIDQNRRLINTFYLKESGHLLRFDNLRLRFSTRLSYSDIKNIFTPGQTTPARNSSTSQPKGSVNLQDEFLNLLSNFTISHDLLVARIGRAGKDTTMITTNTINMVGSMRLTPNWSVNFGNIGYDFRAKRLTYPDIGLTRDLHCWQMTFSFQPDRNTYSFYIGVKPGTFDFLKYQKRRGIYDTGNQF